MVLAEGARGVVVAVCEAWRAVRCRASRMTLVVGGWVSSLKPRGKDGEGIC